VNPKALIDLLLLVPRDLAAAGFELRDALPLLVALAGILLFYPSPSR
jgi:hypothetical protein